jgi:hypothetical protein
MRLEFEGSSYLVCRPMFFGVLAPDTFPCLRRVFRTAVSSVKFQAIGTFLYICGASSLQRPKSRQKLFCFNWAECEIQQQPLLMEQQKLSRRNQCCAQAFGKDQ